MRYNPNTNRYRNVNPRALGNLLNCDTPVNCSGQSTGDCACTMEAMPEMNGRAGSAKLASACALEPSLAMVYSPYQYFDKIYSPYEALCHGTLFSELNKPWKAGGFR